MKKVILILVMAVLTLVGGAVFAACGTTPAAEKPEAPAVPVAPTLEKSSFSVFYSVEDNGGSYSLVWNGKHASEYKVVCGGTETTVTKPEISLNGYEADTVHTVTVTAVGDEDLKSDPVEVKFKGTKLETPYNVRLYGDTKSLGWKGNGNTSAYIVSCEELDLDTVTSKPFGTGKFKYAFVNSDRLAINQLREIYSSYDLYALESFRVGALPYNGYDKRFDYTDETDVMEFELPSDFSEQSVNLYAGNLSNPTNLRWDFEEYEKHPGTAYVKWDGANPDYKYKVLVHKEGSNSSTGMEGEKGASQGRIFLDYTKGTGDYVVTVEPEYNEFNFIGEDIAAKSVTYMFYLLQPATEELHFRINETVLKPPENIRIEGENLLWDEVEYARSYSIDLENAEDGLYFSSKDTPFSLKEVFDSAEFFTDSYEGDYGVKISANAIDPVLVSFENNVPVINTYRYSEYSEVVPGLIRLKAIPAVKNVSINYENNTIYWDGVEEAVEYRVGFYREEGGGHSTSVDKASQYTWDDDVSQYNLITIQAECEYEVTTGDGIVTIIIPSLYRIEI